MFVLYEWKKFHRVTKFVTRNESVKSVYSVFCAKLMWKWSHCKIFITITRMLDRSFIFVRKVVSLLLWAQFYRIKGKWWRQQSISYSDILWSLNLFPQLVQIGVVVQLSLTFGLLFQLCTYSLLPEIPGVTCVEIVS